jgi:hypothetical protein
VRRFWLGEVLPELAEDLDLAFRKVGRPDLADRVWEAEVIEPCPCTFEGCGTFYTQPRDCSRGKVERFFNLEVEGLICVHVVSGWLAWVELLGRPDVSKELVRLFWGEWADAETPLAQIGHADDASPRSGLTQA